MIVPDWSGTIPVVNGNADSLDTVELIPETGAKTLTIDGSGFGVGPEIVHFDRFIGTHGELIPNNSAEVGGYTGPTVNVIQGDESRYYEFNGRTYHAARATPSVEDGNVHISGKRFVVPPFNEFRAAYRIGIPIGSRWPKKQINEDADITGMSNPSMCKPLWFGVDGAEADGIQVDGEPDLVIGSFVEGYTATGGNSVNPTRAGHYGQSGTTEGGKINLTTWYQRPDPTLVSGDNGYMHNMTVGPSVYDVDHGICKTFQSLNDDISGSNYQYSVGMFNGWFGNDGGNNADIQIISTDLYLAIGPNSGKFILLANNSDRTLATEAYIVPHDNWSDTQIELTGYPWEQLSHYFVCDENDNTLASGVATWL